MNTKKIHVTNGLSEQKFMDINFEYPSITDKNFSSFDWHLVEIFKFLIGDLSMAHPVFFSH